MNLLKTLVRRFHISGKTFEFPKCETVDAVVDYVASGKCKNVVTMVGAGVSTSAGIPDFRSPRSGLYYNLQKYNLPYPESIFDLTYFNINNKPFFQLAKEIYPGNFKPTKSHYFIKLLHNKSLLTRHYTQNIDMLDRMAGIEEETLVEAHGTFHTGHCLGCRKEYSLEWMKEKIFKDKIPYCNVCSGVVKPDIVFFGEQLPKTFFENSHQDFDECHLLIVMGSSLVVHPFASLVYKVRQNCPILIINQNMPNLEYMEEDSQNVFMLGDCDEQCQILADKLGWGEELVTLVTREHTKLEEKKKDVHVENKKQI